ncbi:T6SS phospholipase effector Tle1-like catalytic domain-containing protein [Massilia agri]|uniref:DUF2235 domain-containing protein n=1 Tax=Massilia agri TaxID=1886785 RepID=A0ABT2ARP5_9BURK|nr:DUF2235 domain-containing protein [Massilia agri]MCS0598368.1 DUF2235 domain-containing protein [Massilia agri]
MTKSQDNDKVGDSKSPVLKPQASALRSGVDQAGTLAAEPCPALRPLSAAAGLAAGAGQTAMAPPPGSCRQRPWLSFFFDGTGNNLDADVGTSKHSNVAKLYRVHAEDDPVNGVYRIYIPGVGTYFRDVGDDGGGTLGLGSGRLGDARLDWALAQFDQRMSRHLARANSPGNEIIEINIALFGFSRGAALARAFANMLLDKRCVAGRNGWRVKQGNHRLRIRFMGLFDTVASVGLPMSTNNVGKVAAALGLKHIIATRLSHPDYEATRPASLAFAEGAAPGADPAPGRFDGHQDWGGRMAIPDMVEHVRHFVAAHEIRNSFPVDSVSILRDGRVVKPEQFHETVFPGAHSDVGGSYRPGEGGRSSDGRAKLGLVPLHSMYRFALENHVPLLGAGAWKEMHREDFDISPQLLEHYNHYQAKLQGISNLGPLVNAHMALYLAWRFRAIRLKQNGSRTEANEIARVDRVLRGERTVLDREIAQLEQADGKALRALNLARQRRLNYIQSNYGNAKLADLPRHDAEVRAAQGQREQTESAMLEAKARRDALPDMSNFASMVAMYDAQLIADAKAIRAVYTERGFFGGAPDAARRRELRPHYKILIEAYENEFIHNKGLKDDALIAFFDRYVHDSLAGFAKDATLPSDPRVIYLGGDEKYRYAGLLRHGRGAEVQYASAGGQAGAINPEESVMSRA